MSCILRSSFNFSLRKLCTRAVQVQVQNRAASKSTIGNVTTTILQYNRNYSTRNLNSAIEMLISKLNENAKKSRRVSVIEVRMVVEAVKAFQVISAKQSLILIRFCGNLLIQEKPETRTALVHEIWNTLEKLGAKLDIRHYNALLSVYWENNHSYDSADILDSMKEKGLEPNRITYQRLLKSHCQMGDINGAVNVVKMLHEKQIPLDVSFFNALIVGLSKINNIECVEDILDVLEAIKIDPSSETLSILICTNIEMRDLTKVDALWQLCDQYRVVFKRKYYFDIIYAYAICDFDDEINKVLNRIKKTSTYDQDATNLSLKLVTSNKLEASFKVLKTIDERAWSLQNMFIAHLVRSCESLNFITKCCNRLMKHNLNPHIFNVAMETCLRYDKEEIALGLFHEAKINNVPVRYHYFWPLLVSRGKENDVSGMLDILSIMVKNFGFHPNTETIKEYVLPYMLSENTDVGNVLSNLNARGVDVESVVSSLVLYLLIEGKIREAADIARCYQTYYPPFMIREHLVDSYLRTEDIDSFVTVLKGLICGIYHAANSTDFHNNEDIHGGIPDHREYAGLIVQDIAKDMILRRKNFKSFEDLLQSMLEHKIGISVRSAEELQNILVDKYTPKMSTILEKLVFEELPVSVSFENLEHSSPINVQPVKNCDLTMNGNAHSFHNSTLETDPKIFDANEKQEAENVELSHSMYVNRINTLLECGQLHEALDIYEEICRKLPHLNFEPVVILRLAWLLVQNKHYYQALGILKRKLEYTVEEEISDEESFVCNLLCWNILNLLAEEGNVQRVKECTDLFLSGKFVRANDFLLGPLIKVHIIRNDLQSALDEFAACVRRYNCAPWKKELSRHFVVRQDEISLSRLYDLSGKVHGKLNATYDFLSALWECSCIRRARKILETPDLTITQVKSKELQGNSNEKAAKLLKTLLSTTQDTDIVDRSEVYHKLLSIYNETDDYRSASSLWKQMQEEDCRPSKEFLILLAEIMSRHDISIPFEVPTENDRAADAQHDFRLGASSCLRRLIDVRNIDGALELKQTCQAKQFNNTDWSLLIEACMEHNRYADVKKLLAESNGEIDEFLNYRIMKWAIKVGDIDLIQLCDDLLPDKLGKRRLFDDHHARAYLNANRVEQYLMMLVNALDQADSEAELKTYLQGFPRDGILTIMAQKYELIPFVEILLEKCAEKGGENLAAHIRWIHFMSVKNFEKADQIWETHLRHNDVAISFRRLISLVKQNSDVELGTKLIRVMESKPDVQPNALGLAYGTLIAAHLTSNSVEEALKVLEHALSKLTIDQISRVSLDSLKAACLSKSILFPYDLSLSSSAQLPENDDSDTD